LKLKFGAVVNVDLQDVFLAWKQDLLESYSFSTDLESLGKVSNEENKFATLPLYFDLGLFTPESHGSQYETLKRFQEKFSKEK